MIGGNAKKSFSGGYPTRAEFSRLLKTGVLLTAAGTLMSCQPREEAPDNAGKKEEAIHTKDGSGLYTITRTAGMVVDVLPVNEAVSDQDCSGDSDLEKKKTEHPEILTPEKRADSRSKEWRKRLPGETTWKVNG